MLQESHTYFAMRACALVLAAVSTQATGIICAKFHSTALSVGLVYYMSAASSKYQYHRGPVTAVCFMQGMCCSASVLH